MIEIIEYTTEVGVSPFRIYFDSIKDERAKSAVAKALNKMEVGLMGQVKSLNDGLQEIRVMIGEGHRIYFYRDGQKLVVLLGGSTKGDQKRAIKAARDCLNDYKRQGHQYEKRK